MTLHSFDTPPGARVSPPAGAPARARIHEVGPRDGLQAEPLPLDAELKTGFARGLLGAGVSSLEVAAFVHPARVPQMADAEAVVAGIGRPAPGVRLTSLVPNERGLDRALAAGADAVAAIASVTESFARENMGMTRDESLAAAVGVTRAAKDAGRHVRGYLSMCFGDPWEGPVDVSEVVESALVLAEAGSDVVVLSDTIGVAHAGQVETVLEALAAAGIPGERLAAHFHDTYGQALANVRAALPAGVAEFDASASGLGRCPFAPGATGNLATEDLVWMLHGLGYDTGIDLRALMGASDPVDRALGRTTASAVKKALSA
ncbi:hydroxymethylglutaryl-CoA lyase [Sediminivirga luteola]|uniref:Hydroxymethylglutaryl-CoA lyase n=1 Tax=Sediminivirga luteola TaxID=1774748 RepID=A0A8J2U0B8_9MICO|nr:hydroxymethylglutaryl-CoA lyase [Sediminivirga luteola]MCI2265341.1 hydroxymethylglutaryl-CoA lyase [Sediminivirga luteola]GGA24702.1 hydroxymethylglutaryl-CoA lyase [Sediminivirga luteola]